MRRTGVEIFPRIVSFEATTFIRGTATTLLADDNGCEILHPIVLRKHDVISRVKSRMFRLDESRQSATQEYPEGRRPKPLSSRVQALFICTD